MWREGPPRRRKERRRPARVTPVPTAGSRTCAAPLHARGAETSTLVMKLSAGPAESLNPEVLPGPAGCPGANGPADRVPTLSAPLVDVSVDRFSGPAGTSGRSEGRLEAQRRGVVGEVEARLVGRSTSAMASCTIRPRTSMASASLAWLSWTSRVARGSRATAWRGRRRALDRARSADDDSASCRPLSIVMPGLFPLVTPALSRRSRSQMSIRLDDHRRTCRTARKPGTQRSQPTTARKVRISSVHIRRPRPGASRPRATPRPARARAGSAEAARQARAALRRSSRDSSPVASPPHWAQCSTWRHDLSRRVPFGVEQHHEGLRHRVDVEPEVGAPTGGRRVAVQIEALQDAPEAHPFGIEEPGAVTGLQDERFHGWIIAQKRDDQPSTVLRLCDDRMASGRPATLRRVSRSRSEFHGTGRYQDAQRDECQDRARRRTARRHAPSWLAAGSRRRTSGDGGPGELADLVLEAVGIVARDDEAVGPDGVTASTTTPGWPAGVRIRLLATSPEMSAHATTAPTSPSGFRTVSPEPSSTTVSPGTATLPAALGGEQVARRTAREGRCTAPVEIVGRTPARFIVISAPASPRVPAPSARFSCS